MRATARRTGLFTLLLVVLWGAVIALVGAPAASAHSALVSSNPADGATVAALPQAATLTFNEEISGDFTQVVVQGAGEPRAVTPAVKGPVVTAPLPPDLGGGRIVVRYRVVSKDGHPIAGEIAFTVSGGSGPASGGAGAPTAAPTGGAGSSAGSPAATPRAGGASAVGHDSDNVVAYVLTGCVAVALLGIGLLIWRWDRERNRHLRQR